MRLKPTATVLAGLTALALLVSDGNRPQRRPRCRSRPNLIQDSGAESAKQADASGVHQRGPRSRRGPLVAGTGFTVVKYGSPEFIAKTDPGPKPRGHNFFAGGEVRT